jgi:hypothetical protein
MIPGVFAVLVAMIAIHLCSPVRADSACLEQPSQPAAEGTRWSAHYDRAKGRKCWVLVDASANGHDAAAEPNASSVSASVETLSSQIASLLGNLTGASANATPQATTPQAGAASVPRKPQGNAANASKTDNGVRTDQRGEGHAVKRVNPALTQPEREALFEEFLRWQQNEDTLSTLLPGPASH